MNRISLSVVSLVLIRNNNGKLYTGFLYIRKRTVPFVHEFTATDQRERITRGCCAAVAFTTKTFARSFRDKRETKWYFPADMRYEKNFAVHAYKYINVYMYIYEHAWSAHNCRDIRVTCVANDNDKKRHSIGGGVFETIDRVRLRVDSFSTLRGDLSLDCLPFVREWRLCAELDLWLVSSEAAPAVTQMFEYSSF